MDLLLDLARAQKFDLAKISILSLVDQYLAVIEGARRVRLELAADWLVMAAWLTWLKSRLLVPAAANDDLEDGEMAAEALATRLREMNVIRTLAAWLAARPVLGQDVFARGAPESHRGLRPVAHHHRGGTVRAGLSGCDQAWHQGNQLHAAAADLVDGAGRAATARGPGGQPAGLDDPGGLPARSTWTVRPNGGRRCRARCSPAWRWPAEAPSSCGRRRRSARSWCAREAPRQSVPNERPATKTARGTARLSSHHRWPNRRPDPVRRRGLRPVPPPLRAPDEDSLRLAEALVFASAEPVSPRGLARILPDDIDADAVLAALRERYAGRGVELVDAGNGVMFRSAVDLAPRLRKVIEAPRRLPRVAMETLAIIAYHQPMTRPEIEHIRGTALSQQTLDSLLELNLIAPKGRRESPGRPTLWGTTPEFLAHFGLKDLRELPRREDLLLETAPPRREPENLPADLQPPPEPDP